MQEVVEDKIQTERLKRLYRFWHRQRCIDGVPLAAAFEIDGLSTWARDMVLIEVRERRAYRYGYYGTTFRAVFGVDMTGAELSSLPKEQAGILIAEYEGVRRRRGPTVRQYEAIFNLHGYETWERLALPLAGPDGAVKFILAAAYRQDRKGTAAA